MSGEAAAWQAWWRARAGADGVVRAAARQGFVLTGAQFAELGVSRAQVRTAVRRGRYVAAGHGCVAAPLSVADAVSPASSRCAWPATRSRWSRGAPGGAPPGVSEHLVARRQHALACAAAAIRRPGHVVSGRSAATLHGLPTFGAARDPELTLPRSGSRGNRPTSHVYRAALPPVAVSTWFGVPVTTAARTVIDLARHGRRDGIIAADAALRERLTDHRELFAALGDAGGWPGVRQARRIVELADPRSESPLESITRLAFVEDGFPPFEPQVWIGSDRVDFLFGRQRLVVEVDGRVKYIGDALWREKLRETRLRALGYRVERLLWSDVARDWPATRRRLQLLLAA